MKEPFANTPSMDEIADDTSFTFGHSQFVCDSRSQVEETFKDKASKKAFAESDVSLKILTTISYKNAYRALEKVMTPILNNSFHPPKSFKSRAKKKVTTTQNMLSMLQEDSQTDTSPAKAPKKNLSQHLDLISLIHEYSQEQQSENTAVIYRQPNAISFDPLVFLPYKIPTTHPDEAVGLKISAWASGGANNHLTSADNIEAFKTLIIALCIGGANIVGLDKNGGFLPIIKHNIQFFLNQKIIGIKVLDRSFYEEVQLEMIKRAILPLMQQVGNKNEKHLELRSSKPNNNELEPHHLYVYPENNELYYVSSINNTPKIGVLKKTDFGRHHEYYDRLIEHLQNPGSPLDTRIKDRLFQIAMSNEVFPRDFTVVCHLPYIDYIMFGVRLYVEGCMTKRALGEFCSVILQDVKNLKNRTNRIFSKARGIDLIIATPFENLFDIEKLLAIFNDPDPKKTTHIKADAMSEFVLNELELSTDESVYANANANLEKSETPIEQQQKERQAKIVSHLQKLLINNQYNPLHAAVWRDFIQVAETMGNTPTTLEELFKIANAVLVGIGSHDMAPHEVCSLQPYSEKPIQTTFDKFSQKANEFNITLLSIPEGKEIPAEQLRHAETSNTPILIQKTKISLPDAVLKDAHTHRTPILVKKDDEYSIQGFINGQWQTTKLDTLTNEELTVLNKLKTQNSQINKEALKGRLLEILKKGHNGDLPESANIYYINLVDEYSVYGVKDEKWQMTTLPPLSKEKYLLFNKLKEATLPNTRESLKPFMDYVKKAHSPKAKYPFIYNISYFDSMAFGFDNEKTNPHTGMTFYFSDILNKAVKGLKQTSFIFNALRNGARNATHAIPPVQTESTLKRK